MATSEHSGPFGSGAWAHGGSVDIERLKVGILLTSYSWSSTVNSKAFPGFGRSVEEEIQ
jgi:hypothetical protein